MTAEWARSLAQRLLASSLPRRWSHTAGVAKAARRLVPILGDDAELIEAAARLHDIGYSPEIAATGFHPIDGARYLRDEMGCVPVICCLVAHHSGAEVEAAERGVRGLKVEFDAPRQLLLDALTYSDMTTDPDGRTVTIDERLGEILRRYDREHVVHRSVRRSSPMLRSSTERIERLLQITGAV